jgi:hypothetical protein
MANQVSPDVVDKNETDHTAIENQKGEATILITDDEDKTILRKIDWQYVSCIQKVAKLTGRTSLMPLMFITYGLQYLDKTTLGNANVLGMAVDTVKQESKDNRKENH